MSDPNIAPFYVGQRVRLTDEALRIFRVHKLYRGKSTTGVVTGFKGPGYDPSNWRVLVQRDGYKSRPSPWMLWQWEPVPIVDLTADETAQSLADAVKRGDLAAALPLADHLIELYGGTPRE